MRYNAKKIILHIPHSSCDIPLKDGFIVNEEILENEIMILTDWHTDDLFHSENQHRVVTDFSRIFCDVERFSDDGKEIMAQFGMGAIYERRDSGELMRIVSTELREKIMKEYYEPHHQRLTIAVEEQLYLFGDAFILDCHSFPDIPLNRSLRKSPNRPDFNIGTDKFHTPDKLIETCFNFFKNTGYSIGIDVPYTGSIVPMKYYQKNKNIQTIMLEVNRKLYLRENSNEPSETYEQTRGVVQDFIELISEWRIQGSPQYKFPKGIWPVY